MFCLRIVLIKKDVLIKRKTIVFDGCPIKNYDLTKRKAILFDDVSD